jgi:hypothetical protein
MYKVYQITMWDTYGNSHGVNRDETWGYRELRSFTTEAEATNYSNELNLSLPDYKNMMPSNKSQFDAFAGAFLTEDRYLKYRRYFVGVPPMREIARCLSADGVITLDGHGKPF